MKREKTRDPDQPIIDTATEKVNAPKFNENYYLGQILAEMLSLVCHEIFLDHPQEV